MSEESETYVIIRIQNNLIEVVKIGDKEFCEAAMYRILHNGFVNCIEKIDCDHGARYKVKRIDKGEEIEIEYILQSYYEVYF